MPEGARVRPAGRRLAPWLVLLPLAAGEPAAIAGGSTRGAYAKAASRACRWRPQVEAAFVQKCRRPALFDPFTAAPNPRCDGHAPTPVLLCDSGAFHGMRIGPLLADPGGWWNILSHNLSKVVRPGQPIRSYLARAVSLRGETIGYPPMHMHHVHVMRMSPSFCRGAACILKNTFSAETRSFDFHFFNTHADFGSVGAGSDDALRYTPYERMRLRKLGASGDDARADWRPFYVMHWDEPGVLSCAYPRRVTERMSRAAVPCREPMVYHAKDAVRRYWSSPTGPNVTTGQCI